MSLRRVSRKTRDERPWWRAIPALAALLACVGFGVLWWGWSPRAIAIQYEALVRKALARQDYETVRIASLRRLALGYADPNECKFQLAQALRGQGAGNDAYYIMTQLAPLNQPGYPPAHLELANAILNQRPLTAALLQLVELHLAAVQQTQPHSAAARTVEEQLGKFLKGWKNGRTNDLQMGTNDSNAHQLAAWVYLQLNDVEAAKPHLLAEARFNGEANFLLAEIARRQGDVMAVRRWYLAAAEAARARLALTKDSRLEEQLAVRRSLVRAELGLEDFDAARQVLLDGQKIGPEKAYQAELANLYYLWAKHLHGTNPGDLAVRLNYLQAGLALDTMNLGLLHELDLLGHESGPESQTARDLLAHLLAGGPEVTARYSLLGIGAYQVGDLATASNYFARAYALAPQGPDEANNLALMLAKGRAKDCQRALAIVNKLLDKSPEQPHYRETRGEIEIGLEDYDAAVADLEFAEARLDNEYEIHHALAQAYRLIAHRDNNPNLKIAAEEEENQAADLAPQPAGRP